MLESEMRRLAPLEARIIKLEAENERLRLTSDHYYRVIEDIYLEELNGVFCTPPYKTTPDVDGFGGFAFPDYDAPVERNYCGSCRSIWQRIHKIIRASDEC